MRATRIKVGEAYHVEVPFRLEMKSCGEAVECDVRAWLELRELRGTRFVMTVTELEHHPNGATVVCGLRTGEGSPAEYQVVLTRELRAELGLDPDEPYFVRGILRDAAGELALGPQVRQIRVMSRWLRELDARHPSEHHRPAP